MRTIFTIIGIIAIAYIISSGQVVTCAKDTFRVTKNFVTGAVDITESTIHKQK